jgi:hypothetical protein
MAKQLNLKSMRNRGGIFDFRFQIFDIKYWKLEVRGWKNTILIILIFFQVNTEASSHINQSIKINCTIQSSGLRTTDCGLLLQQQPDSVFNLIKTIAIEAKDLQTDRLGNMYVISKSNQLYKYSIDGKLLSTLNYKYLGNISFVDVTNPLEIYVFYKELNMVVFLDNNLAYRGEMNLADYGIGQAAAVARSFDNGIWIFDVSDMQLKKMDKDGGNFLASGNMRQYISQNSAITYLYDNTDRVFVNDSVNGIYTFDVFATYLKTIPIKGCHEIKVINEELFYHPNQSKLLKKYQLKTFQTSEYTLPEADLIKDVSIEKNRLYLLKATDINIYGFE